jgi:hypothetical protein
MMEEGARWSFGRFSAALAGAFLLVFSVAAISGPGRMDIIDGQPRYEVARSLADHGDVQVRDPKLTFCVFPGRDGQRYSLYRLPQSLLGVPAILLADATGEVREERRQFFFVLTSAFAGAVLAVVYVLWFRRLGHSPLSAVGWGLAGIFCTPCWFYSTSIFDDILGTTAVVAAVALAWQGRAARPRLFALLAGLALGAAFHCKQPLALFVLPVLAIFVGQPPRTRLACFGLVLGGLALGVASYAAYEWYKFPPGSTAEHARLLEQYVPAWPGTPLTALAVLLVSPAAGVFWYCPTLLWGLLGVPIWYRRDRLFVAAVLMACMAFSGFICSLVFFKGDLAWGPRYLTPVFAVLWLFVPAAARARPRWQTALVLSLGMIVQLLALSVDFHRLYVQLRLPSGFYQGHPEIYFYPQAAHLINRPREVLEIVTAADGATAYSPNAVPTAATPCPEWFERGPEAIRKYRFLSSLRPWWASMNFLPATERPVDLATTIALLLIAAGLGLGLIYFGVGRQQGPVRPSLSQMTVRDSAGQGPPSLARQACRATAGLQA